MPKPLPRKRNDGSLYETSDKVKKHIKENSKYTPPKSGMQQWLEVIERSRERDLTQKQKDFFRASSEIQEALKKRGIDLSRKRK